jgi:serine/threonine protein kinase
MLRDLGFLGQMGVIATNSGREWHANAPEPFGPYYLHELINKGGLCEIWTATDEEGRHFALRRMHKMAKNGLFRKSPELKSFRNGCEILQAVHDHPFVIDYLKHGTINKTPYMLMDYVEGNNLKQLIGRHDSILAEFLGNILIDMAEALDHVHDAGYMHLDFKPENVLVTRNGDIRLCDFDLAQPRPVKPTRLKTNAGTPAYMAPEQMLNEPLDHRADIYAFGVTAYEILTFRPPFDGNTPDEVLRKKTKANGSIVPPRDFNDDIPIALQRIVMKCLDHDPDKRYVVTTQLVKELHKALYV